MPDNTGCRAHAQQPSYCGICNRISEYVWWGSVSVTCGRTVDSDPKGGSQHKPGKELGNHASWVVMGRNRLGDLVRGTGGMREQPSRAQQQARSLPIGGRIAGQVSGKHSKTQGSGHCMYSMEGGVARQQGRMFWISRSACVTDNYTQPSREPLSNPKLQIKKKFQFIWEEAPQYLLLRTYRALSDYPCKLSRAPHPPQEFSSTSIRSHPASPHLGPDRSQSQIRVAQNNKLWILAFECFIGSLGGLGCPCARRSHVNTSPGFSRLDAIVSLAAARYKNKAYSPSRCLNRTGSQDMTHTDHQELSLTTHTPTSAISRGLRLCHPRPIAIMRTLSPPFWNIPRCWAVSHPHTIQHTLLVSAHRSMSVHKKCGSSAQISHCRPVNICTLYNPARTPS